MDVPGITEAERLALSRSSNESQDSQQILLIYAREFGVGIGKSSKTGLPRRDSEESDCDASTSPAPVSARSTPVTSPTTSGLPADADSGPELAKGPAAPTPEPKPSRYHQAELTPALAWSPKPNSASFASGLIDRLSSRQTSRLAPTAHFPSASHNETRRPATSHSHTTRPPTCASDFAVPSRPSLKTPPPVQPRATARRKSRMDTSQASPTQQNDDRDYQGHFETDSRPGDSPIPDSQDPIPINVAHAGDVVNFAPLSFLENHSESQGSDNEPSSPVQGPGPSLSNSRRGWKLRTSSSQQGSSLHRPETQTPFRQTAPVPETPAVPLNPFAGKPGFGGTTLGASQLFGQTQQSSAIKAAFSPTSSRPSPALNLIQSISPNVAETPFKDDYNISPPTVRPSSRQVPTSAPRGTSSFANHQTPAPARWRGTVGTFETPSALVPKQAKRKHEPMAHYESMKESQERRKRSSSETRRPSPSFGDDSDDEMAAMVKRRRVAKIRESASRVLAEVTLPRPELPGRIEVPGTTQKDHSLRRRQPAPAEIVSDNIDPDDISTVADSQEHPLQGAARPLVGTIVPGSPVQDIVTATEPGYISSNERIPDSTACTLGEDIEAQAGTCINPASPDIDRIPETSPLPQARTQTQVDQPLDEGPDIQKPTGGDEDPMDSLPEPSRRSRRVARPSAKAKLILSSEQSPIPTQGGVRGELATNKRTRAVFRNVEEFKLHSDVSVIPESSPGLQTRHSIGNMPSSPPPRPSVVPVAVTQTEPEPKTPIVPPSTAPANMSASTSSLSSLSSMQDPAESASSTQETSRRRPQPKPVLPNLRTALDDLRQSDTRASRRSSRHSMRRGSTSTDELARSVSSTPAGFENSMIKPQKSVNKGSRPKPRVSGDRLFDGMAFAVSFQSKRPGEGADAYQKRMDLSKEVDRMIQESGGRLLSDGFDELFDSAALKTMATSPVDGNDEQNGLGLASDSRSLGFTALIADGHSRKVKYMQALALGLPCISDRWIIDCINSRSILDWLPYLLCAGQSAFLRGAIRSRFLNPYPASDAQLIDVVEQRVQLMKGSKILLVMKKSRQEEKKMLYVFLTHVLGATLLRAYSIGEAQDMIRQRDLLGSPFDWVYVDENTGTEGALFGQGTATTTGGKKRKRQSSTASAAAAPPCKKVRTLNDELVIQSLILGRMIEEGELDG